MRVSNWIGGLAAALVVACTDSGPLEDMQPGESGRVVRVIDGDALVLDTGQSVRLVGIEAPALGRRYGEPDPFAKESKRTLEDLVLGRQVRLYYPGLTRDRYDRALAHIQTLDGSGPTEWINLEMVRRGAARVRLYPDTDGAGEALLLVEQSARRDGEGLWSLNVYRPQSATRIAPEDRGFMIIRGTLGEPVERPEEAERRTLCSRALTGSGIVVDIEFSARPSCDTPVGAEVELRGWLNEGRMELVHPLHLQTLDTPEG